MPKTIIIIAILCNLLTVTAAMARTMPPVVVNVVMAKQVAWQPEIESTGTLIADQGVNVAPDISGRITAIYFKSGQYVKAGTPLVQIYPNILKAQLAANDASLTLSKLTFERDSKLFKKKAVSRSEYDTSAAGLKQSKAAVAEVQAKLNQTLVRAPFSGYLGIRSVNLGDYVSAGTSIVNLQDVNPMYIDFNVPEVFISKMKVGQKIEVGGDAYGNKVFIGKISAIDSIVNPKTRTLTIRAQIPNKNRTLMPGAFMEVSIYLGKPQQVVSIPQTAIVYSAAGDYVYRVVNKKAVKTLVTIGQRGVANIIVLKGLKPNDVVVTAGEQKLYQGAFVIVGKSGV